MECIQLSLFGKTYPEHSVPTAAKISEPCWKNLPALHSQTFQFLDLRVWGADGAKPEQSPETDGLWHGDSSMLNTGESPNAERESRLSWILEDNVPQKYYLSKRACQGILTRASRRGKPLPDILKQALLDVIGGGESYTLKIRSGCDGGGKGALVQTEKSATLSTLQDQTVFQPVVYDARGNGDGKIVPTITGDYGNRITDYTAITLMGQPVVGTLLARDYKGVGLADSLSKCVVERKPNELQRTVHYSIRRLTPVECERLQGFPDGYTDIGDWTDSKGKKHKYADSPRYKALGNSIALPQWFWLVQKMRPYLKEKPTLGSLFDGLGGFPLVWQRAYGEGTARWASEIESFCVAVTKRRFGEE